MVGTFSRHVLNEDSDITAWEEILETGKIVSEGDGWYICVSDEHDTGRASWTLQDAVIPKPCHTFNFELLQRLESVCDEKAVSLSKRSAKWLVRFHRIDLEMLLKVDCAATRF